MRLIFKYVGHTVDKKNYLPTKYLQRGNETCKQGIGVSEMFRVKQCACYLFYQTHIQVFFGEYL